jgi:hypothetical protein
VVVDDLDVICVAFLPAEADTVSIVDPPTVLTRAVSTKVFQPVPWKPGEVQKLLRGMKLHEPFLRCVREIVKSPQKAV